MDENGMMDHLAEEFQIGGHEIILVRAGAEYGRDSRDVFHFSPAVYGSYLQLMNTLRTEGLLPDRIVHGWLLDSNNGVPQDWEMFQRSQEKGFYSLMLLTQAASKVIGGSRLDIHVLSTGLCAMEDTTSMDTSKSTILGVINCIDREFFNIRCQSIDVIVPPVGNRWQRAQLAKFITGEIIQGPGPEERSILYRGGEKWRRVYRSFPHLPGQAPALRLKEKGVYLITGGAGNLGMLLCEHLVSHYHARVMLISRRRVLDPEKQEKIRVLQEKGWSVEWMSADIGIEVDLVKVREKIGALYGALDGIFHFAADITENAFFTIDNFQLEGVLQNFVPKVQGLINVRKVFGSEPLDFIMLASSQSAILGGLGNSAYAAANIYLDQSALREGALSPYPVISINWDLWEGTSDSHNSARQEKSSSIEILLRNVMIKPEEGMQVIEMALAAGVPHLVVSTSDFNARIAYTKVPGGRRNKDKAPLNGGHLSANYVAPRNETEAKIAEVWQYALGIDKIGVHDNFFELGGDSLQAVRMLPQLQAVLQKEIPLRDLIMDPTIAGIANIALNGKAKMGVDDSPILLQLKKPGTAEKSRWLVCIPYAGGNAIIYQSLVQSLPDNYDVYAVNPPLYDGAESLENGQDIQTFAQRCLKEILAVGEQKLSLYGHCGGSVLTLEIASLLESRGVEVEKVFLGAVLPLTERDLAVLPDPTNLEAFTNEQMYKFLVQLGGIDSALSFENSSEIINGFRLDAINSFQYYQEIDHSGAFKKLKAPIIALIGDADPLMNDYRNRYKQWGKFSQEVFLEVIEGGGHYFIKDRASEVSGIIKRYLKSESVVLS
jgi:surfactin synthase thioesterase subunit/acyl carrier protein